MAFNRLRNFLSLLFASAAHRQQVLPQIEPIKVDHSNGVYIPKRSKKKIYAKHTKK